MSREVRRVPLDFDFPTGQTWTGYLRPADLRLPACPDCHGHGETAARQWLHAIARLILMLGEDVHEAQTRGRHLHPYLANMESRPYAFTGPERDRLVTPRPSVDALELSTGLAGRPPSGPFGHDSCDAWVTTQKIVETAGLPETWGTCATCNGEGEVATPEQREAHDAWTPTDPPTGDAYQLWQTVSEGGPVSPPFAAPEELADWIIASGKDLHGARTPRDHLVRRVAAEGSSFGSFVGTPDGIVSGVEAAATAEGGAS